MMRQPRSGSCQRSRAYFDGKTLNLPLWSPIITPVSGGQHLLSVQLTSHALSNGHQWLRMHYSTVEVLKRSFLYHFRCLALASVADMVVSTLDNRRAPFLFLLKRLKWMGIAVVGHGIVIKN